VPFLQEPKAIEAESYRTIERLVAGLAGDPAEQAVAMRIIHATGDPAYAELLAFAPNFVSASLAALRRGAKIFTDVEMVRSGINKALVEALGGEVICAISRPEVREAAQRQGRTRAMTAIDLLWPQMAQNLVVIGNAPTALFRLLELCRTGEGLPAAVIGTPVGFVGAAEAKAALEASSLPYLTVRGTKGGSTVAVAAVNALLHLAREGE